VEVYSKKGFEELVHLVGFIKRILEFGLFIYTYIYTHTHTYHKLRHVYLSVRPHETVCLQFGGFL